MRDQPLSDKGSVKGAANRAKSAMGKTKADFGVGLEGGIQDHGFGIFECGWEVVLDKSGKNGTGSSAKFEVPKKVYTEIKKGRELKDIFDELSGVENIGETIGAFGVLTKGGLNRTDAYENAVACALMPFVAREYYK